MPIGAENSFITKASKKQIISGLTLEVDRPIYKNETGSRNFTFTTDLKPAINNKNTRHTCRSPDNLPERVPCIAIVIYGLGKSAAATRTAIQELPGEITLAFWPHSKETDNWIAAANAAGHEALIIISMEPRTHRGRNLPLNINEASYTITEFRNRLKWILERERSYVGTMSIMGSHFTSSPSHMQIVFSELKKNNLLFLRQQTINTVIISSISGVSAASSTYSSLYLDQEASRNAIDRKLIEIERIANLKGKIIVFGFPYPVTFERLKRWIDKLETKNLKLVPISYFSVE